MVEDSYNRRILGDATGEIGPFFSKIYANNQQRYISSWYGDEGRFVWKEEEWFNRSNGLIVGTGAGIFSFDQYSGSLHSGVSFRVVLSF